METQCTPRTKAKQSSTHTTPQMEIDQWHIPSRYMYTTRKTACTQHARIQQAIKARKGQPKHAKASQSQAKKTRKIRLLKPRKPKGKEEREMIKRVCAALQALSSQLWSTLATETAKALLPSSQLFGLFIPTSGISLPPRTTSLRSCIKRVYRRLSPMPDVRAYRYAYAQALAAPLFAVPLIYC